MDRCCGRTVLCVFSGSTTLAVLLLTGCNLAGIVGNGGNGGGGGNGGSAISATAGNAQFSPISTAFPTALQATVKDGSGNAVSGVTVTFTGPSSGAGGTFNGGGNTATAITNSTGVATASAFTADSTAGNYSVVASIAGGTGTASFSLTNTDVTGNWGYAFLLDDGTLASGTLALVEQGANFTGTIYDPGVQVGDITGNVEPDGTIVATWNFTTFSNCQTVTIKTTSMKCPPNYCPDPPGYGGPETGFGSVTSITSQTNCTEVNHHGSVSMTYNPLASPGLNLSGAWIVNGSTLAALTQSGQNVTGSALAQDGTLDAVSGTAIGTAINVVSVSPYGCTATIVATEASDGNSFSGTATDAGSSCNQTGNLSVSATRLY